MIFQTSVIPHQYRNKYYLKTNLTISKTDSTSIYNIPTNVSQLINDSNYATVGYVDQRIAAIDIPKLLATYATVSYVDTQIGAIETLLSKIIGE